jgi:hypothetical protein
MTLISKTDGKHDGHLMLNVEIKKTVLPNLKQIQEILNIIRNANFPIVIAFYAYTIIIIILLLLLLPPSPSSSSFSIIAGSQKKRSELTVQTLVIHYSAKNI